MPELQPLQLIKIMVEKFKCQLKMCEKWNLKIFLVAVRVKTFFLNFIYLFIYFIFIYGCVGSSFLCEGFL